MALFQITMEGDDLKSLLKGKNELVVYVKDSWGLPTIVKKNYCSSNANPTSMIYYMLIIEKNEFDKLVPILKKKSGSKEKPVEIPGYGRAYVAEGEMDNLISQQRKIEACGAEVMAIGKPGALKIGQVMKYGDYLGMVNQKKLEKTGINEGTLIKFPEEEKKTPGKMAR